MNSIVTLSSRGLVKVTGERARELLQGQLTCDLNEITSTHSSLGAHCNPQGRIISLFRIIYYQNNYYLLMPKTLIPSAINALKKYAIFFKVELHDVSDQFMHLGYYGDLLSQSVSIIPQNINDMVQLNDLFIINIAPQRYEIIDNLSSLQQQLAETNNLISENDWKYLDIQAGIPAIYPETSEIFLPHEISLPQLNGVSFNKGCYTGQEIIARMQYRGKLKTEMVATSMESATPPKLGDDIVDFCKTGYNSYQMLVIARKQDNQK